MRLSRGAMRLSDLIQWYARKFPSVFVSVAKMAEHLSVCTRTVKRWLAELRQSGKVAVEYHGPRGAVYCYKNVPDCTDCTDVPVPVPVPVPDCVPDLRFYPYMSSGESSKKRGAQSATEPGPEQRWGGQPQTYFGARRAHNEPSAVSRPQLSIEEREALRDARKLYPMASYDNLMECVRETLAAGMRKPPASEQGQNVFATAEVPR